MNIKEAQAAIREILASIPDEDLPEFDKVEIDEDGRTTVWWGGTGRILGSARTGGVREPIAYRRSGAWDAIQAEMTYRTDQRFLDNGDKADGVRLGRKIVRR